MKRHLFLLFLIALLLAALTACQSHPPTTSAPAAEKTAVSPAGETNTTTQTSAMDVPQPTATIAQPSGGPGTFNLDDPAIGLNTLTSYRLSLVLGFDGTVGGQETHNKTTLRRTVTGEPAAQITWLETDNLPQQMFATVGEVAYRQSGAEGPCAVSPVDEAESSAAAFQVQALPLLRGAEESGEETVNNVPSRHYTFDERALGQAGAVKAKGDVWVATEGGYVVKYTLSVEGEAGALGPDVAGVQSWTYELTEPNAVAAPDLPQSCAAGEAAIPTPPEARDIVQLPGFTEFTAALSAEQAAQFYQDQAASLGWEVVETIPVDGADTILNFRTAEGAFISIRIHTEGEEVQVTVQALPKSE